jgi:glutathione S-transferase
VDQPSGGLSNNQHLTPEFIAINPKGLVPVLVHDGIVVTESSDIVDYVDQHFPDPPLRPCDPAELDRMYSRLNLWDETQICLKTLSHNTRQARRRRRRAIDAPRAVRRVRPARGPSNSSRVPPRLGKSILGGELAHELG